MKDNKMYKVGLTPKGTWNKGISYERLDFVLYRVEDGGDGCGYVAKNDNIGITPGTNDNIWMKSVEHGQSIYDLVKKYGDFDGTEEEFEQQYLKVLRDARDATSAVEATDIAIRDAESERAANESARVVAELARGNTENARSQSETERVNAERGRVSAEQRRVQAEADRNTAESARVSSENSRESAETSRANNESSRTLAENARRSRFAALETDMEIAIGQADASVIRANDAIANVEDTVTAMVAAEGERVQAEDARIAAEKSRASAEDGRAVAETNRETRANSDHTRAESDHSTAAADHTQANSDHTTAAADHTAAAADHTQAGEDHTASEAATTAANTAAAAADAAREGIQDEVAELGQKIPLTAWGTYISSRPNNICKFTVSGTGPNSSLTVEFATGYYVLRRNALRNLTTAITKTASGAYVYLVVWDPDLGEFDILTDYANYKEPMTIIAIVSTGYPTALSPITTILSAYVYNGVTFEPFSKDYIADIATLKAQIESLETVVPEIQQAVFNEGFGQLAGPTEIGAQTQWYSLDLTNVTTSTNLSFGYKGMRFPCKKGDRFLISTRGGSGGGRSYAVADANNRILEVASSSQTDFITTPLDLTISQDDAAYLYVNCLANNSSYANAFYVKKYGWTINRIEILEEKFKTNLLTNGILLLGASFAYSGNEWFGNACAKLALTGINEAVSGSSILYDANRAIQGTLFNNIESFDVLAIMHVLNYNVNALGSYANYTWQDYESDTDFVSAAQNDTRTDQWISCAFDYLLKKYAYLCYQCKNDANSLWYNKQYGKPAIVVICSSWHDARQKYNNSAKELCARWGHHFVDIASKIGFSCQMLSPATGAQPSIMFAQDTQNTTFEMDGEEVTQLVGWHPYRGAGSYAQEKIANIFSHEVAKILW